LAVPRRAALQALRIKAGKMPKLRAGRSSSEALLKHSALEVKRSSSEALLPRSEANMVVGIGIITFRLHECRSLKGKRKVVKSIISRIRNNFNASVAEVGSNDIYQRAEIGFSLVGNDKAVINSKIDKIVNLADDLGLAEIIDTEMEIIHL
jgi:uncharacterized protein YlxP (DUF503 family)